MEQMFLCPEVPFLFDFFFLRYPQSSIEAVHLFHNGLLVIPPVPSCIILALGKQFSAGILL